MRLLERLRIRREAQQCYEDAIASGKTHDEASEILADSMQAKYGGTVDWARIIEIIMMILALFQKT